MTKEEVEKSVAESVGGVLKLAADKIEELQKENDALKKAAPKKEEPDELSPGVRGYLDAKFVNPLGGKEI